MRSGFGPSSIWRWWRFRNLHHTDGFHAHGPDAPRQHEPTPYERHTQGETAACDHRGNADAGDGPADDGGIFEAAFRVPRTSTNPCQSMPNPSSPAEANNEAQPSPVPGHVRAKQVPNARHHLHGVDLKQEFVRHLTALRRDPSCIRGPFSRILTSVLAAVAEA